MCPPETRIPIPEAPGPNVNRDQPGTRFWIKHDKKGLVIGQSFGGAEVGNVKAIPSACVRSIKVLSRAKV